MNKKMLFSAAACMVMVSSMSLSAFGAQMASSKAAAVVPSLVAAAEEDGKAVSDMKKENGAFSLVNSIEATMIEPAKEGVKIVATEGLTLEMKDIVKSIGKNGAIAMTVKEK